MVIKVSLDDDAIDENLSCQQFMKIHPEMEMKYCMEFQGNPPTVVMISTINVCFMVALQKQWLKIQNKAHNLMRAAMQRETCNLKAVQQKLTTRKTVGTNASRAILFCFLLNTQVIVW